VVTFSDALTAVRRWLWSSWVFPQAEGGTAVQQLPEPFTEQPGLGMPLLVDRSGNIWFSGEEHANAIENGTGIWRYDGKAFRNFSTKEGMGNFGVWCMVGDRDGNIWVGTRNTGLYRYDGRSFTCFSE
jgi:hypothetical protein